MRFLCAALFAVLLLAPAARAQDDSIFKDYNDLAGFVDQHMFNRDFVPLILRLGGRDEYNSEELAQNNQQLRQAWPKNFEHVTVFRRENLGGDVHQEGRMYWTGTSYAYFYMLMHDRPDGLVVISFNLNSNSRRVMERF